MDARSGLHNEFLDATVQASAPSKLQRERPARVAALPSLCHYRWTHRSIQRGTPSSPALLTRPHHCRRSWISPARVLMSSSLPAAGLA